MEPKEYIRNELKKNKKLNLGFAVMLFIFAAACYFFPETTQKEMYTKYIIMAALVIFAFSTIRAAHGHDPCFNPLMVALDENPDDIVWVYFRDVVSAASGAQSMATLVFNMIGGKSIIIQIPIKEQDKWKEHIKKLAPKAKFGYYQEYFDAFCNDPASVKNVERVDEGDNG